MRVLLITRPRDNYIGGDFRQVERTAEALRIKGHTADIIDYRPKIALMKTYDIVHLFTITKLAGKWIDEMRFNNIRFIFSLIYRDYV